MDSSRHPIQGHPGLRVVAILLVAFASSLLSRSGTCSTPLSLPPHVSEGNPATTPRPPVFSNTHLGPLMLRGQSPLQLPRLGLIPMGGQEVPGGGWLLHASTTWTNRWAWKENKYLVDGEIFRVSLSATYGLTDWMQVRLEIPFSIQTGGCMDAVIEGFHDLFDLTQAGRDQFPRNRYQILFWRKDGTVYKDHTSSARAGLEDIVLSARFLLTRGTRWIPQTTVLFHLKLPTGDPDHLFGSGSTDGGVALSLSKRIWRIYTYLDLQYTRYSDDRLAGIPLRTDQFSGLIAFEYPWTERLSVVAQLLSSSGAARDFYQFSESTHEVTLGLKARFLRKSVFEFGLIENLFHYDNSPDFGLHFGIYQRF